MNFTKATDEQLKNIIEWDIGIPTPLLKEVYEEGMKRQLFHNKIVYFITKQFGTREKAELATKLNLEDLIWICYEIGYEIIDKFKPYKPFAAYWHRVMINEVLHAAEKNNKLKRKGDVWSMEDTFEWKLIGGNYTESIALNRIQIEEIMNQLTDIEKDIVIKRYQGYTLREIGKMQGVTLGGVVRRIELYQKRLKGA